LFLFLLFWQHPVDVEAKGRELCVSFAKATSHGHQIKQHEYEVESFTPTKKNHQPQLYSRQPKQKKKSTSTAGCEFFFMQPFSSSACHGPSHRSRVELIFFFFVKNFSQRQSLPTDHPLGLIIFFCDFLYEGQTFYSTAVLEKTHDVEIEDCTAAWASLLVRRYF
jgi:hypothetical protein